MQQGIDKQADALKERLKRRRKQNHTKNTINIRKNVIRSTRKADIAKSIQEKFAESGRGSGESRSAGESHDSLAKRDLLERKEVREDPRESKLVESQMISNKDDMLGSLAGSDIQFESELHNPSERQAKQFIQNIEEGMKEHAVIVEQDVSLSVDSKYSSRRGSAYEENKDVLVNSEKNSFDENKLRDMLNSVSGFNNSLHEIAKQAIQSGLMNQDSKIEQSQNANLGMLSISDDDSGSDKNRSEDDHLKEMLRSDEKIDYAQKTESGFVLHNPKPSKEESEKEEEFLSEVQEPKIEQDYMPVSYQNSVRNNALMSELMDQQAANYVSIRSNGVELRNSGLMMDLGMYDMYKESNLMSGLHEPEAVELDPDYDPLNNPQDMNSARAQKEPSLMSDMEDFPNEEILMSAIQMKNSELDEPHGEARDSLERLKAKVIKNSNLMDSSLFSRRELNHSKRKTLEFSSTKQIAEPQKPAAKPLISEMVIGGTVHTLAQDQKSQNKKTFVKSNWNNHVREEAKFEEVGNEDEIMISDLQALEQPAEPGMILDTIIPELGINLRAQNLQDSLTTYDESRRNFLNEDPEQIKEQYLKDNYNSQLSMTMTLDEEKLLEKKKREIEAYDLLTQSRLSELDDQDAFVYRGSDDEDDPFKEQ